MTRDQLVAIWRDATGLPFHPGSATERGLRAVLLAISDDLTDGPERDLWHECYQIREILDDSVNTK